MNVVLLSLPVILLLGLSAAQSTDSCLPFTPEGSFGDGGSAIAENRGAWVSSVQPLGKSRERSSGQKALSTFPRATSDPDFLICDAANQRMKQTRRTDGPSNEPRLADGRAIQSPSTAPVATTPDSLTGAPLKLRDLRMFTDMTGWAITTDGVVLRTTQGMAAWRDASPPAIGDSSETFARGEYCRVCFLDENHAWVAYWYGEGGVSTWSWETHDGGGHWHRGATLNVGRGQDRIGPPVTLRFVDPEHGWLLTQRYPGMHHFIAVLSRTTDAGATWEDVCRGKSAEDYKDCYRPWNYRYPFGWDVLAFLDLRVGFAGTRVFCSTDDGGETWQEVALPQPSDLPAVVDPFKYFFPPVFADSQIGAVVMSLYAGDQVALPGDALDGLPVALYVYFTQDGGRGWSVNRAPARFGLLTLLDAENVWFLGRDDSTSGAPSLFYHSKDRCATWTLLAAVSPLPLGSRVSFISAEVGYAIGPEWTEFMEFIDQDQREWLRSRVLETRDGGRTWNPVVPRLAPE